MKKLLFTLTIAFLSATSVFAQKTDETQRRIDSLQHVVNQLSENMEKTEEATLLDKIWKERAKYFNISYVNQELQFKELENTKLKSQFGVAISKGRTYYLHKKPILKMIKFGIDWTQFDINYVKYSELEEGNINNNTGDSEESKEVDLALGTHQVDVGMHFGLSLTVNPVSHLKVSGYYRFAPSASIIILDSEVSAEFVPFSVFGGAIAYKAISFGIEARTGSATYSSISFNETDESDLENMEDTNDIMNSLFNQEDNKLKTVSTRFYISFRF